MAAVFVVERVLLAYGGITTLLEDGDLLVGGAFTYKRVLVDDGN